MGCWGFAAHLPCKDVLVVGIIQSIVRKVIHIWKLSSLPIIDHGISRASFHDAFFQPPYELHLQTHLIRFDSKFFDKIGIGEPRARAEHQSRFDSPSTPSAPASVLFPKQSRTQNSGGNPRAISAQREALNFAGWGLLTKSYQCVLYHAIET
jgi:hypothetical protein